LPPVQNFPQMASDMVKHGSVFMGQYFTRERYGRPQFLAGFLLLAFLGQALWLVHKDTSVASAGPRYYGPEELRVAAGWRQWHGEGIAGAPYSNSTSSGSSSVSDDGFDNEHSPLLSVAMAAPLLVWPQHWWNLELSNYWRWLPRLPFLACGLFLGASLWYVARRLCGNTGGFVALTLYCFSPSLIQASAVWHTEPEIVAVWGAFGTIFTAIAVAHTLYAPREVVLWNWRRILLLGVALGIAVGAQFSMIVLVPLALIFLLYVAPVRRQAGAVIWVAACVVGFFLLFAFYFFQPHAFVGSMQHAIFWGATWRGFTVPGVYKQVATQIGRACPALAVALPVAAVTYGVWRRTRYFGNTAPMLVAALFLILGMAHPHAAGEGFLLAAVPFLFIFVSGVLADLMETRGRPLATAGVLGMMVAYVAWSLYNLALVQAG
jgi:hypothetical protein